VDDIRAVSELAVVSSVDLAVVYQQRHARGRKRLSSRDIVKEDHVVNGVLSAAVKVRAVNKTATAAQARHRRYTGNWVIYAYEIRSFA